MSDNHDEVPFSDELTEEQARAALGRSQMALQESEARYRALFDTMLEGFAYCQMLYDEQGRPIDWVYLHVNAAFAALTGLTDVVGKRVTDVIPGIKERSPQLFEIYHRVASTGRPERFEFDFTPLTKWLNVSVTSPSPGHFVAVFEDITERKRAKEALGRSEAMYRTLIEQAPDAVFILDPGGQFLLVNPCFCSMLGYTEEELLQADILDTYLPEDLVQGSHRMTQLRAGERLHFERQMRRKDGGALLVEARALRLPDARIQAFVRDITARKQAEEAVREAETRYRLLFEHSPDGVVIIDPMTARPLEFNRTAHEQLGYSREEFAHPSIVDLEAMESPKETESRIAQVMRDGRSDFDTKQRTRQGEIRDVHVTAQFTEFLGKPAYHCIWRDITDQKRAEETLRDSEERYRRLFELESDAIVLVDSGSGRVLEVNTAMTTLYGYSREEWLSMKHTDVSVEAEKTRRAALEGETQIPVRWHRKKDGTIFPVEITASHFELAGRSVHVAAIRDISAREQTEQALRDSEARSRSYFELPHIGLAITSPETKGWLEANESLCAMLGYSAQELSGLSWADMTHPEDLEADLVEFSRVLADEIDCYSLEKRFICKSGEPIWTNLSVGCVRRPDRSVDYIVCLLQDITERKKAEEALRTSEGQLRALIEAAPIAIIQVDLEERVKLWNPAAERIFGWKEEEVLNQPLPFVPADGCEESAALHRAWLLGEPRVGLELVRQRKDGTPVDVELSSATLLDWEGKIVGSMGLFRDISQQKGTADQLRQAQKMEAVGQLAGGIAHDFNNLLTAIIGHADLALDVDLGDSPGRADVVEIKRAAERAASLTRQILAFSRRQTLQPRVVSVNEVLESLASLLTRTLGEEVDLEFHLHPKLRLTEVDPSQLQQVLLNLVVNARQAMPSGGRLTVETANARLGRTYCRSHPGAVPGSFVMLAVTDTGHGMDTETLTHIFEPFFTTKPAGEGTGLGLSTVYGIVKQSGGYISVYSEPGHGSSFKVYLPQAEASIEPQSGKQPVHIDRGGHETILVVEDEPAVRSLVSRILTRKGYALIEARDGIEAQQLLRESETQIDLLLSDVMLPGGVQGHLLAKLLQADHPKLPVLFMSGYPKDAIVHDGRLDEGVNFLEKPFTSEVLAAKVREVLDAAEAAEA